MDQKARVVYRFGVYLLLKVVLHEIKNILQHFHRLHGLRHVVALALAVYQMKGDIPGFLLRQFNPVLLYLSYRKADKGSTHMQDEEMQKYIE